MSGVGIIPPDVVLINRFGVVTERAIIAAHRPFVFKASGQSEVFGDFRGFEAVIDEPYRLIVQVFIDVTLLGEIVHNTRLAPDRPVLASVKSWVSLKGNDCNTDA